MNIKAIFTHNPIAHAVEQKATHAVLDALSGLETEAAHRVLAYARSVVPPAADALEQSAVHALLSGLENILKPTPTAPAPTPSTPEPAHTAAPAAPHAAAPVPTAHTGQALTCKHCGKSFTFDGHLPATCPHCGARQG